MLLGNTTFNNMNAEDTQLYMDFRDSLENAAMSSIQSCMQVIKAWLTYNVLLLNDKETESVMLGKQYYMYKEDI